MRVKKIKLDADELPKSIVVELTLAEAAYIAKFTGREVPSSTESHELYASLSSVFNSFWDAGVDEVLRGN